MIGKIYIFIAFLSMDYNFKFRLFASEGGHISFLQHCVSDQLTHTATVTSKKSKLEIVIH